ncbi:hypothetical protein OUZ56_027440 [Daphnia magna]|uniref:Uncharacterized protein n=1 Tax=Daphnia magna TaxID=35525 RepID=A0ABQ9ZPS3_9CRUS|nr:hypothetical protein OUZ56_027440 [Daphnia magna]
MAAQARVKTVRVWLLLDLKNKSRVIGTLDSDKVRLISENVGEKRRGRNLSGIELIESMASLHFLLDQVFLFRWRDGGWQTINKTDMKGPPKR